MAALRPLALRYSTQSRAQLLAIREHVAREGNTAAALRVGRAIREATELLTYFPLAGRNGIVAGTREWVVRHFPYILVYEVTATEPATVIVLGVFHSSQDRGSERS